MRAVDPCGPLSLVLALLVAFGAVASRAGALTRTAADLVPLWARLDAARDAWRGNRTCDTSQQQGLQCVAGGKSYSQMISAWTRPVIGYDQTPQQMTIELATSATGFKQHLGDPLLRSEAEAGIQESLNEYMAGQALVGNEKLIQGLRTRFPGTGDSPDVDQLTFLTESRDHFSAGINGVLEELRLRPGSLRAASNTVQGFPIFVRNSDKPAPNPRSGDTVENEFHRFTELVYRQALASNAIGRRKFFFDNTDHSQGGGREQAARSLKRSAQATYLSTAILTAVQSRDDFQNNNGFELKRQVLEAQRIYDDVQSGFNPLKLLGDFVPKQPVESFLRAFDNLLQTAQQDEANYKNNLRAYDTDQTALASELRNQQERYLDELEALTGIDSALIKTTYNDLRSVDDRDHLIAAAEAVKLDARNPGQLRSAQLAVEQAGLDLRAADEQLRSIPEKIRIEEERQNAAAQVTFDTGLKVGALQLAATIAEGVSIEKGSLGIAISTRIGALLAGTIKSSIALQEALSRIDVEEINSAALIKNLLLQAASNLIAVERAGRALEARQTELEQVRARLQRAVRNYFAARQDLASAYFSNPAYRLQLDLAKENADASFEAAMVQGYFAAKALEYEWAERFSNPVERIGVGLPEPIGDVQAFAPFSRAESVFAVRSAGATDAPRPALAQFRQALQLWDQKMRQLRGNELQPEFTEIISLRKDVLGYIGGDEQLNRLLFADYLAKHRVAGRNPLKADVEIPFSLSIADQRIFPAETNLKMVKLSLNLRSRPGRVAADAGRSRPLRIELVMLDEAELRTFFADFSANPADDDLMIIDLEGGRSLSTSPFRALVQASLDGTPPGLPDNVQLANLSPAVSRWVLRIDMSNGDNTYLLPEYLDDIELRITYKFGRPRPIAF